MLTGVPLTSHWRLIIYLGAGLFLDSQKLKDIQAAYRRTLALFCPKGKVQNDHDEWEWEILDYTKGEVFSPRQFEYHLLKEKGKNLQKFFEKRFGTRKVKLRYRALNNNSTRQAHYPGALYQIDATIADVYLVSRLNRTHIIGRPVIVIIIDVFSRMIVGICVRPEREKWTVVNLALMNAIESKVEFCKKFGIHINPDDWPVMGLPDGLTGDRGTMISYNSDNLADGLGINISNTPAFRPDWKGIIEQLFRLMNIRVIKYLPGAVDHDHERGDRDVRLDAALDINDFMQILIKAVLYHNNNHLLSQYPMSEEMITAGVRPIPRELFRWGFANLAGRPREKDEELVYTHLLPSAEASMTKLGLKFRGEYYTCDQAEEEGWRFRARNAGSWNVSVGFDPRLPGYIYLRSSDGSPSIRCHLMHPEDSIAAKYDLAEIDAHLDQKFIEDQRQKVPDMQARVNLELGVESISEDVKVLAVQAQAASATQSNRERVGGIRDHMKAEAELMDEEYREGITEKFHLTNSGGGKNSFSDDQSDDEYIPRPGFSNVLSIQERMSRTHD